MAVGELTSAIEVGATSIAAGIVVGGFVAGWVDMILGLDPASDNRDVVRAGHYGGMFALGAVAVDLLAT